MPRQISSFFQRLGQNIREFTIAQRTVAIIGVAVLALGIAALTMWATKPAYTPLFSGLAGADASAIVDQLATDKVDYQLSDGGATILVPQADVYAERLKAAAAGLPTSDTGGYSLLDKMGVTASEFQQSVTYKRALEGELANTIQAMQGVKTASVRLAIPKDTVFVSEKQDPTASVFVATQTGVTLSSDQVQAIVHLTSASIDGMKPTDVAVIDSKGIVLSAVGTGVTGTGAEQSTDYEQRVRGSVQAMLDKVLGAGNATVVVAADMSAQSASRVEESFTSPTNAPALNEAVKTETYTGTGASGAAGVLGTTTTTTTPTGTSTDGSFTSADTTKNNAVNKVTETRTIPAGAVNRQTISVAVNKDTIGSVNVADVTSLVSSAAGIDSTRGDAVTVEVVSFNGQAAADASAALAQQDAQTSADRMGEIVRIGIITAGILITLILGMLLYARRSRRQSRESIEVDEMLQVRPALAPAAVPFGLNTPIAPIMIDPSPTVAFGVPAFTPPAASERMRVEIDALAQRDPKKTAEYLRGLMEDRQPA
ncbi:flagellar M-ring protein FliF [Cryobacterium sp. MDB1-18-2]|uniref:Flagellar M-ring protein n=1 Tax=Cryobacterium glucosi TaxID=1259175 RepID=A0ABY2IQU1_9MICO|nr:MULTISPECIES: flagellar basal-body MS-ring/collar protein FliF [Cryobacterium]TFC21661.1 flagellar M-ring protein FliF [Cryobacterium glucosi]TFC24991.1 flagellar M-ring protein FliF [Cryobacterium sp. MDB1-18-2]TFC45757.1 flagellar M-ring protein FliF [Cryobacterium sp. MDB1-18-1]